MKPPTQLQHGIGSGIIISPEGYIITNNHVVDGATQIRVTLNDRRVFPAKLVGVDKLNDLAVIRIDAKNLSSIARVTRRSCIRGRRCWHSAVRSGTSSFL